MPVEVNQVTVVELIEYVTTQLIEANRHAAEAQRKVLLLNGCTLTLEYEASRDQNGNLDLKVIGGGRGSSATAKNTITLAFRAAGEIAVPATQEVESAIGQVERLPASEKNLVPGG